MNQLSPFFAAKCLTLLVHLQLQPGLGLAVEPVESIIFFYWERQQQNCFEDAKSRLVFFVRIVSLILLQ
jgi:hypothetical protein